MQVQLAQHTQWRTGLLRSIAPRNAGFWCRPRPLGAMMDNLDKVKGAPGDQVCPRAAAGSAAWFQPSTNSAHHMSRDLSWCPSLTNAQEAAAVAAATVACTLLWTATHPARFRLDYAAGMAILFAFLTWLARNVLLERMHQAKAKEHVELGDPDSIFTQVANVTVHAKASVSAALRNELATRHQTAGYSPAPLKLTAVHCYHGFGANLYSYAPVQAKLAEALGAVVTSHDMPGFGLTQRPASTSEYFLLFNGALGMRVLDQEVASLLASPASSTTPGGKPTVGTTGAPYGPTSWPGTGAADVQSRGATGLSSNSAFAAAAAAGMADSTGMDRAASPMSVLSAADSDLLDGSSSGSGLLQPQPSGSSRNSMQHADVQKILIGHSLGSMCASLQAVEQPGDIAALVLVAPAIVALPDKQSPPLPLTHAPPMPSQLDPRGRPLDPPVGFPPRLVERFSTARVPPAPPRPTQPAGDAAATISPPVDRLWRVFRTVLQAGVLLMALIMLHFTKPLIILLLRALVRSRNFWLKGLQQAYYNPAQVTSQVIDAYRLPQLVKGWEAGMFMFFTARLAQSTDWKALGRQLAQSWSQTSEQVPDDVGLVQKLRQLAQVHGTPILIVHGVHDKLVPASNSRRLASMLPGCELVLLGKCGHIPQEEWPGVFVQLVREFVARRVPNNSSSSSSQQGALHAQHS